MNFPAVPTLYRMNASLALIHFGKSSGSTKPELSYSPPITRRRERSEALEANEYGDGGYGCSTSAGCQKAVTVDVKADGASRLNTVA